MNLKAIKDPTKDMDNEVDQVYDHVLRHMSDHHNVFTFEPILGPTDWKERREKALQALKQAIHEVLRVNQNEI